MFSIVPKKAVLYYKKVETTFKDVLERESFKLVLACFLKLSFFCVFVGDFCSPPRSSGLAPNKGHEKRWHLGMARLLHGRTGHWWLCEHVSSAFKRHVR